MNNDNYFMDILDMCDELEIEELEILIGNIEIMIENKKEEE